MLISIGVLRYFTCHKFHFVGQLDNSTNWTGRLFTGANIQIFKNRQCSLINEVCQADSSNKNVTCFNLMMSKMTGYYVMKSKNSVLVKSLSHHLMYSPGTVFVVVNKFKWLYVKLFNILTVQYSKKLNQKWLKLCVEKHIRYRLLYIVHHVLNMLICS